MARWIQITLVLTLVSAVPAVALAQAEPQGAGQAQTPQDRRGRLGPAPGSGRAGRMDLPAAAETMTAGQVEQLFDRYVLNQARAALQLSPGQFGAFRLRLGELQMVRRRTQRERQRLVSELAQLTRGGGAAPDEDALAVKLKALEDQAVESGRLIRDAYQQLEATLSVPQRARFRVFEQRMEQRKLELIAQARQQARRGGPPAPETAPRKP